MTAPVPVDAETDHILQAAVKRTALCRKPEKQENLKELANDFPIVYNQAEKNDP
jgi:hypothetical protein